MDQRHGAGYASATSGLTTATCPALQDCHEHYNKGTTRRVAGSGMVTQIACSLFPATLFDLDLHSPTDNCIELEPFSEHGDGLQEPPHPLGSDIGDIVLRGHQWFSDEPSTYTRCS